MFKHAQTLTASLALVVLASLFSPASIASAATKPAAPGAITHSGTPTSVTISWTKAANATSYKACLLDSATTPTCSIVSPATTGTSVTFKGLEPLSTHWYRVTAYNGTLFTTSIRRTFTLPAPAKPSAPTATHTATTNSVKLSWPKAANATSYKACLLNSPTTPTCSVVSPSTTGTSVTFSGLKPTSTNPDYWYRVTAYNGTLFTTSARSSFNLVVPVKPAVPGNVTHRATSSTVRITWSKAAHATSYKACLLTSATATSCSAISAPTTGTSATFMGLKPTSGADWYYRVTAYNSTLFTTSARETFDLPVAAVDQARVVAAPSNQMTLTWVAAANAESYVVRVATNAAMTGTVLSFPSTTPRVVTSGLSASTTYYFTVQGIKDGAVSSTSDVQRLTPTTASRVVVMTYNLCGQNHCLEPGKAMTTWSNRKGLAGIIVRSAGAGIIATQESGNDTNFLSELPGYGRTTYKSAKSLFYDKAKYTVKRSGWMTLNSSSGKYAVWAEFQDRLTGGRFIVADAHTTPYKGKALDDIRYKETSVLISGIKRINTGLLPVVYAGDYNSNPSNANQSRYPGGYDAPRKRFAIAAAPDTADITPTAKRFNYDWNSANQATNPPLRGPNASHVDHIYVSPGIGSARWQVLIEVNGSNYATPFASDHNPVMATVTIPVK